MTFFFAPTATPSLLQCNSFLGCISPLCSRRSPPRRTLFLRMQATMAASNDKTPYKVGFCLSGAATGGAYSAGAMDFLLEALAAWDREKNAPNPDPSIPQWDIALTEIIGTSAGGINSTLTVNALNTDHQPLPRDYQLSSGRLTNNSLFNVWVYEVTYQNVLKSADLDRQEPFKKAVASFLNADFMKDTVEKVLSPPVIHNAVPAWAANLHLSLTSTNLRGVPYSAENFIDTNEEGDRSKYHMRKYADYTQFKVALDPANVPETEQNRIINLSAKRTDSSWQPAIVCSRATAAFPIGLPTVSLHTPQSEYEHRLKVDDVAVAPDWAEDDSIEDDPKVHSYSATDGGVLNNEPFGILIKNMEDRNDNKKLESEPEHSWGSVILVDPFPSTQSDPQYVEENMPLVKTIASVIAAMRGESSFKEEEVVAALSETCMEKFMIAPKTIADPTQDRRLATTGLGTFAGILDPSIAYHDFLLGRQNCKYFLENIFVMKREHALKNTIFKDHLEHITGERIPIIPVVGSAKDPIQKPEWPHFGDRKEVVIKNVMEKMDDRIGKVLRVYMENLGIIQDYRNLGFFDKIRQSVTRAAGNIIEERLRTRLYAMAEHQVNSAMAVFD